MGTIKLNNHRNYLYLYVYIVLLCLHGNRRVHLITSFLCGCSVQFLLHLVHFLHPLRIDVLLHFHVHAQDPLVRPGVLLHTFFDAAVLYWAHRPIEQVVRAVGEAVLRNAIVEQQEVLELQRKVVVS